MIELTRRQMLATTGASFLVPSLIPGIAQAGADMLGTASPTFNRFKLGEMEVTTLLAGTRTVEEPQKIFGLNASADDFAAASAAAHIPTDKAQFFFTPTVVNTGAELVLFDTGLNPQGITAALAAAGYSPDQVDLVVLTHMHGDHIGGLMHNGTATFANARYATAAAEYDHWAAAGNDGFDTNVRPLAERMDMLQDGASPVSGVTALAAPGHTPGHTTYMLDSGGKQLLIAADFANHYVWSLAHPDWEVRFDRDKAQAAATRRQLLTMLAGENMPFIGYHMPFPGFGYVETRGEGFHYTAASYQHML